MEPILLTPLHINSLEVKNRVVLPSLTLNFAEDGAVAERDIAFHVARARGGCGLNILDGALLENVKYGFRLALDDDRFIEPLSRLAKAMHDNGGKVGIQLLHHGRCMPPGLGLGRHRLVSVVPGLTPEDESLVMDEDAIAHMKSLYVAAAIRAKKAGMDLVELSGGHGYLLAQFMSPLTNKRTDRYGGSFENRMRFPLEVLAALREALGLDYPICIRLSADEMYPGGLKVEDTVEICRALVENGIDMLSISASIRESYEYCMPPSCVKEGWLAERAGIIRKAIAEKVPVMVSGRITSCNRAEKILEQGEADLIGMGRALIADPNLINEWSEKHKAGMPCLGCNVGCTENLNKHRAISCAVNPLAGLESVYTNKKTDTELKIVIVGGGPAGMYAAITAAKCGHKVIIFEKKPNFGGKMDVAAKPPFKIAYADYAEKMAQQVKEAPIEIHLGVEATPEQIIDLQPDVVLLATGAEPVIPGFCAKANAITAEEALMNENLVGKNVLVLGGGAVGAETAEFLAQLGRNVRVVELRDQLAADMEWRCQKFLLNHLNDLGVTQLVNTKIQEITGKSVTVETTDGCRQVIADADTVILSMGYRPLDELGPALEKSGIRIFRIGDCKKPGLVYTATHDALEAVYAIQR